MFQTLLVMFAAMGLGLGWSLLRGEPGRAAGERRILADLVFAIFLPALVLDVLWRAVLGADTLRISAVGSAGVLAACTVSFTVCRALKLAPAVTGTVLLATGWPNVTLLGLPVLVSLFGAWGAGITVQYDVFATTPLVFTLGVAIARRFGTSPGAGNTFSGLARVPALWAAALAVALNLAAVPLPESIGKLLHLLAQPVVPLMLVLVGMALRDGLARWRGAPVLLWVVAMQMVLVPLGVWGLAAIAGLGGRTLVAVVLEAAMPCMALGVVLCDRYGLDGGLYAGAMTLTTLSSLVTLPIWFAVLQGT